MGSNPPCKPRLTHQMALRELPGYICSAVGNRFPPTTSLRERNPVGPQLVKVLYEPGPAQTVAAGWGQYDPANPARDLIQHAMMFRAVHGVWGARNVAVVEVETVNGEKLIVAGMSGGFMHSEQRILAILEGLHLGVGIRCVTRMFTDLEPCDDGPGCANCRNTLATAPANLRPQQIFYSFAYDSGVPPPNVKRTAVSTDQWLDRNKEVKAFESQTDAFQAREDEFLQRADETLQRTVVIDGLANITQTTTINGFAPLAQNAEASRVIASVRDRPDLLPQPAISTITETLIRAAAPPAPPTPASGGRP